MAAMETFKNLLGGFAGAIALNILHETYRRLDHDAPRIDLIGEEALSKSLLYVGVDPPKGNARYTATLAGDLISNSLYFSMIGVGNQKFTILRGIAYGFSAGVGALKLPNSLGLKDAPVTKTDKTKILTVGWYILGGIVAALAINKLKK